MLRCIYGIVHPDDHQEMKIILENTLIGHVPNTSNQVASSFELSFLFLKYWLGVLATHFYNIILVIVSVK